MYQAKVDLDEHGMQGLVRDVKFRRNCGGGSLPIFGGLELMNQFFPALRHPIQQRLWKEARCLANPKLHRSSAALCHKLQEPPVFFWREVCVELLAKGGNHDFCGAGAPEIMIPSLRQQFNANRSEEHTSELQSRQYLVCRLLLEKKKDMHYSHTRSLQSV